MFWRRDKPKTDDSGVDVDIRQGARAGQGEGDGERASSATDHATVDKPDSPSDLTKRSWFYVARKTAREFSDDQCTPT